MKINYKLFQKLNRTADVNQEIDNKSYNIYFATDEEKELYLKESPYVLASDSKTYKVLVEKEAYEFKSVKKFFTPEINGERIALIEKVSKIQKISLFGFMLPLTLILITTVSIILGLKNKMFKSADSKAPTYIIISLMIFVFIASFIVNKIVKDKIVKLQDKMNENIEAKIGKDKVDEISNSIREYELSKQKANNVTSEIIEKENKTDKEENK